MSRELSAEFIGTFTLVTAVCGAALFSAPSAGLMAVAFAVGLSVVAMAYAVGSISGAHFNPAVTCGLVAAGRFEARKAIPYIIAQVIGGLAAAAIFYVILQGAPASGKWNTFLAASNTYGGSGFSMLSAGLIEVVITALFILVIVSVTSPRAPAGFRSARDRPLTGAVSPGRHSRLQCVAEPGALDGNGSIRRNGGFEIAVAVLGCADRRRHNRRRDRKMAACRIHQRSGQPVEYRSMRRSFAVNADIITCAKRAAEKPPLVVSFKPGLLLAKTYSPAASRGVASVFCLASRSSPVA